MEGPAAITETDASSGGVVQDEISDFVRAHIEQIGAGAAGIAQARVDAAKARAASETDALLRSIADSARTIRTAAGTGAAIRSLCDMAARFCDGAILFVCDGDSLRGFRSAGNGTTPSTADVARVAVALSSTPGLARALESKSPMSSGDGRYNKVLPELATICGLGSDVPLHGFPIVLRKTALGLLLAFGRVNYPVIETLVLTTEAWVEALGSRASA